MYSQEYKWTNVEIDKTSKVIVNDNGSNRNCQSALKKPRSIQVPIVTTTELPRINTSLSANKEKKIAISKLLKFKYNAKRGDIKRDNNIIVRKPIKGKNNKLRYIFVFFSI